VTPSKKKSYGFGLPSGPTSPGPELLVYEPLRAGQCDAAQASLGQPDQSGNWQLLPDPSKVLLLQAGVAACQGKLTTANTWLTLDRKLFKATTAENPQQADAACPLYRALVSVLSQVAQSSVHCPTSAQPEWIRDADDNPVDPRSHADAYAAAAASPSGSASPSTSASLASSSATS
jgi:hypothetical protein